MLCGLTALYNYKGPFAPELNFVKNLLTYFYSLFISSSPLHLTAERLAIVTANTSFKVFGLTRLRIEPSLPASKANALNHKAMALEREQAQLKWSCYCFLLNYSAQNNLILLKPKKKRLLLIGSDL